VPRPAPSFRPQDDPCEFLAQLGAGRSTSDYAKNSEVFVQGADADSIFYIREGRVKVTVTSEQGKEAIVAILEAGQFFGEGCLAGQTRRLSTTKTLTNCRITVIEKDSMIKALHAQPSLNKAFMDYLLSRNSRIEADVVDQLFNSSEKRLARLLLLLANFGKEGSPPIVPVILNQETLAEMIGTTRSRVSFFMNRFRKLGLVDYKDYNGKIHVHQFLLESVLREKPPPNSNSNESGKVPFGPT
jgi:CRP/FNR family transcriptional regulator, cyclic AMP receptor protein